MRSLNNSNIALVTGASRGIGYALVEELILNGWCDVSNSE